MSNKLFKMVEVACEQSINFHKNMGFDDSQMRDLVMWLAVRASFTCIHLFEKYGSEQVYIPKKPPNLANDIWRAHNGKNIDELVEMFKVSRATVYRAIKQKGKKQSAVCYVDEFVNCLLVDEIDISEIKKHADLFFYVHNRFMESEVFSRFTQA